MAVQRETVNQVSISGEGLEAHCLHSRAFRPRMSDLVPDSQEACFGKSFVCNGCQDDFGCPPPPLDFRVFEDQVLQTPFLLSEIYVNVNAMRLVGSSRQCVLLLRAGWPAQREVHRKREAVKLAVMR